MFEFIDDGFFQAGNTGDRSVFGEACINGSFGSIFDVLWCIKIGFASGLTNDVTTISFVFSGFSGNR